MSDQQTTNDAPEGEPRLSPEDIDPEKVKREIVVEFHRASGPGGQRRNKVETAVRMRHEPTGIVVTATEERSQARNREVAFERLLVKLRRLARRRRRRVATRKSKGTRARELEAKRQTGEKKRLRTRVREPEES